MTRSDKETAPRGAPSRLVNIQPTITLGTSVTQTTSKRTTPADRSYSLLPLSGLGSSTLTAPPPGPSVGSQPPGPSQTPLQFPARRSCISSRGPRPRPQWISSFSRSLAGMLRAIIAGRLPVGIVAGTVTAYIARCCRWSLGLHSPDTYGAAIATFRPGYARAYKCKPAPPADQARP